MKKVLLGTLLFGLLTGQCAAGVAVIVNSKNAASIDAEVVKRIYTGKMSAFPNGNEAIPVNLTNGVQDTFNDAVVGRSTSQVKALWSKLIFTGKGTPPKEVGSDQEVIELVSKNESVIGYVDEANVTSSVKVLFTK